MRSIHFFIIEVQYNTRQDDSKRKFELYFINIQKVFISLDHKITNYEIRYFGIADILANSFFCIMGIIAMNECMFQFVTGKRM